MIFKHPVSTRALVACRRSCCICHKFCGVHIELDHITPQADGGTDVFDNCIPLCFDCHADKGHYNDRQPKGRKYHSEELRLHRDGWYRMVAEFQVFGARLIASNEAKTFLCIEAEELKAFRAIYGFDAIMPLREAIVSYDTTMIRRNLNRRSAIRSARTYLGPTVDGGLQVAIPRGDVIRYWLSVAMIVSLGLVCISGAVWITIRAPSKDWVVGILIFAWALFSIAQAFGMIPVSKGWQIAKDLTICKQDATETSGEMSVH